MKAPASQSAHVYSSSMVPLSFVSIGPDDCHATDPLGGGNCLALVASLAIASQAFFKSVVTGRGGETWLRRLALLPSLGRVFPDRSEEWLASFRRRNPPIENVSKIDHLAE